MIRAVFAVDKDGGFGKGMGMPWPKSQADMQHFKRVTHNSALVMGRTTANTLPLPLPYRVPIIVSKEPDKKWATLPYDFMPRLRLALEQGAIPSASIIGGTSLLTIPVLKDCSEIYMTVFKGAFDADTKLDKEVIDWVMEQDKEVFFEDATLTIYKVTNEQL